MSQYFVESPTWAYFVLGALAIIFVFAFFMTKRGLYLGLLPVLAALALGFFLLDYFIESDREKVERLTKEMMAAAERHDLDGFAKYLSADFRTGSFDKAELLQRARTVLPQLTSVKARKFEKVTSDKLGRVQNVGCMVDATGSPEGYTLDNQPFYLKLEFIKDRDGEWRVRSLQVWNAFGQTRYYPP